MIVWKGKIYLSLLKEWEEWFGDGMEEGEDLYNGRVWFGGFIVGFDFVSSIGRC